MIRPPKPELRLVPPAVTCPPERLADAQRNVARCIRALSVQATAIAGAAREVGERSAELELASIVERLNRLAANVEPDDAG